MQDVVVPEWQEDVMKIGVILATARLSAAPLASAELVETEIPNVTAEVAELRTSGGVTRLVIRYENAGPERAETDLYEVDKIAIVDVESKKKYGPIQDANNQFIAGPINDEIGGGRIYMRLPPGQAGTAWAYFDAIPARVPPAEDGQQRGGPPGQPPGRDPDPGKLSAAPSSDGPWLRSRNAPGRPRPAAASARASSGTSGRSRWR
jgi:hypothetical protein